MGCKSQEAGDTHFAMNGVLGWVSAGTGGLLMASSLAAAATPDFRPLEKYAFGNRLGVTTDAVLIQHQGKIIYEKYDRGYQAQTPHLTWSVTKTIAAALIGIAEKEGLLHRDDLLSKYIPGLGPEKSSWRLSHFLQMTSGIAWREGYDLSPIRSSVVHMLYLRGMSDMSAYTLGLPTQFMPGHRFIYSSGDTNVLMDVLKRVLPLAEKNTFPWTRLFQPLGIQSAVFEQDQSGTFVGSSYLYVSPRDLLKLGQLYLQNGNWNGVQVIPAEFVQYQKTLSPGFQNAIGHDSKTPFGAHLWLNQDVPGQQPRPYADAPDDTIAMLGYAGQSVFMIPSLDLVIVRAAQDTLSPMMDKNEFLKRIIQAIYPGYQAPASGVQKSKVKKQGEKVQPKNEGDLSELPRMLFSLAAKEYCSCHFIEGQSASVCKKRAKKLIPLFGLDVDQSTKSVRVGWYKNDFDKSFAQFHSAELGCSLKGPSIP
ncbi:MAG: serine hydrolase [Bdellovibrionales bacterium]|nr:serine hydrolase [Bdellovibrionales bacterium]